MCFTFVSSLMICVIFSLRVSNNEYKLTFKWMKHYCGDYDNKLKIFNKWFYDLLVNDTHIEHLLEHNLKYQNLTTLRYVSLVGFIVYYLVYYWGQVTLLFAITCWRIWYLYSVITHKWNSLIFLNCDDWDSNLRSLGSRCYFDAFRQGYC